MAPKRIEVKPGKTQSKMGFAAGIIFVLIGCFVVIPSAGLFGVVWTAMAGIITFMNYKNGFSDDGVATHEIIIEDGSETDDRMKEEEDIETRLIKLNSLYEQQFITQEEYDEKRKELLKEL